jgi:hypothetical protein
MKPGDLLEKKFNGTGVVYGHPEGYNYGSIIGYVYHPTSLIMVIDCESRTELIHVLTQFGPGRVWVSDFQELP